MNSRSQLNTQAQERAEIQANEADDQPIAPIYTERDYLLADLICKDVPICEALKQAGFPESRAMSGWREVPKRVFALILERDKRYEHLGDFLKRSPDATESRVVGKMYHDMMHNEKDGVPAAKVLTQHTSISSKFVQEQRNNVLIIQAPSDWRPHEDAHGPESEPERVQGHKTIDALPFPEYE